MRVLFATGVILILDQITKALIKAYMDLHESWPVIKNFFHITYVTNDGMAFGINFPYGIYLFSAVSMLAAAGLLWYLWHVRRQGILLRVAVALILGGALGNLWDRLFAGRVVDFLDFMVAGHHWPVFNIADSAVTVGMGLFLFYSLVVQPKTEATLPQT